MKKVRAADRRQQKLQILEHYERYSQKRIEDTTGVSPATLAKWERE